MIEISNEKTKRNRLKSQLLKKLVLFLVALYIVIYNNFCVMKITLKNLGNFSIN